MKKRRFFVDLMSSPAEVTGSCTLCVCKIDDQTVKFVVDCGMYQERPYEEQNASFPVDPDSVDFVLLTHNHVDHQGRLPYFVKQGFGGKIYTSVITAQLLGRALNDNARVIKDTGKRRNQTVLYDSTHVEKTLPLVKGVDYNTPVRVNEFVKVTFVPNGHLIGAASILVQIHLPAKDMEPSQDINLYFSGDYSNRNMFFRVPPIRKWITELPLTIVTESTYGEMEYSEIKACFRKNVYKALKDHKTVVIPVFSLGRAQEILYILRDMQKKMPDLFKDLPIYYDGKLSFYYSNMYTKLQNQGLIKFYKEKTEFLPEKNLIFVEDKQLRKKILTEKNNSIIVTTSGMGSYGPAQTYLPVYIGKPNALIHFTGYCAENTLGARLKNTPKGCVVDIAGMEVIKEADVEFTNEFSAHAKADELIQMLKRFKDPRVIFVNHGEKGVKKTFAGRVLKETQVDHVGILGESYMYRIDADGFVKGIPTKFI